MDCDFSGTYDSTTGALSTTGLNLKADVFVPVLGGCTISPIPVTFTTGNPGNGYAHSGVPFTPTLGLSGGGAIAALWASVPAAAPPGPLCTGPSMPRSARP